MRRLIPWCSLLLLALWLPATQHCALEAAGILADTCAERCAAQDNCEMVEAGAYRSADVTLKVPAPALVAIPHLPCVELPRRLRSLPPEILSGPPDGRAPDWILTWQFVQRAAPSPRAPSLSLA